LGFQAEKQKFWLLFWISKKVPKKGQKQAKNYLNSGLFWGHFANLKNIANRLKNKISLKTTVLNNSSSIKTLFVTQISHPYYTNLFYFGVMPKPAPLLGLRAVLHPYTQCIQTYAI